ncbi:DUF421 domain-containing protein [Camelliibacillus cellulosilyticus]|uniref:DUF421 domain-containing protein n=1 Tax=Camelliibacillus cellulosilyticus TaxID=2174486 RepID=A0ABV9GU36_9BACL
MHGYLETTLELIIGFFALLILMKLIGRASIAEATPFDFVVALVLGEFVGGAIYDPKVGIFKILFVIVFWGLLAFAVNFVTLKINFTRGIFESKPSVLIDNGVIHRSEMKKNKIDINRLQSLLRDKNIFSIRDVAYAILEPSGKISVIKKPVVETVQRGDLDLPIKSVSLPVTVISDGVLVKESLGIIGKDRVWLDQELQTRGIPNIRNVMFAEWREEDGLYVQKINKQN